MLIEIQLADENRTILSFDGRVLEWFDYGDNPNLRIHVAQIKSIGLSGNGDESLDLDIELKRGFENDDLYLEVDRRNALGVGNMVAEIKKAMASHRFDRE